jgi:hypothetical protein
MSRGITNDVTDYSKKCFWMRCRNAAWCLLFCTPFIGLSGGSVWFYTKWTIEDFKVKTMAGLLISASVFSFFAWRWLVGGLKESFVFRIVPYFESRIGAKGECDAFWHGAALATAFLELENLAATANVVPLSSFGFNDDACGEVLNWHHPDEGLKTIESLVKRLDSSGRLVAVRDDLMKLQAALQLARDKNVRFCLVIRSGHDRVITPMEMDRRVGKYW